MDIEELQDFLIDGLGIIGMNAHEIYTILRVLETEERLKRLLDWMADNKEMPTKSETILAVARILRNPEKIP